MLKHVIIASDFQSMQPIYFLGYRDDGDFCEVRWTFDPWQALWLDAAEAAIEIALLDTLCPSYRLQSWSLDTIGTPKAG